MTGAAGHTIFGADDLKIDARFLSNIAFLCSADKPVETSTVIGNYAVTEICITDEEGADFMMYFNTLRTKGQETYVSKVAAEMRQAGAKNANMTPAADAIEAEFANFKKVVFLRMRSFEVFRVETGECIGRIVTFPDHISDDYGNNLEVFSEQGIHKSMVCHAASADTLPTVYAGHAQGAAMAELCACAFGRQAIIFDGTTLSEILVRNAIAQGCIKMEPADEEEKKWNIIHYRTDASAKKQDTMAKAATQISRKISEEDKAASKKEMEAKAARSQANGEGKKKKDTEREEEDLKTAQWMDNSEWYTINGIIPEAANTRFARTGRYNAKALSDMIMDYTATMSESPNPFAQ